MKRTETKKVAYEIPTAKQALAMSNSNKPEVEYEQIYAERDEVYHEILNSVLDGRTSVTLVYPMTIEMGLELTELGYDCKSPWQINWRNA